MTDWFPLRLGYPPSLFSRARALSQGSLPSVLKAWRLALALCGGRGLEGSAQSSRVYHLAPFRLSELSRCTAPGIPQPARRPACSADEFWNGCCDVCGWGSLYRPRWRARSCRLAPASGPPALTSPRGDVSGTQQALAHCVCPLGGEVGCQPSQQLVPSTGLPLSGARKRCVQRAGCSFGESLGMLSASTGCSEGWAGGKAAVSTARTRFLRPRRTVSIPHVTVVSAQDETVLFSWRRYRGGQVERPEVLRAPLWGPSALAPLFWREPRRPADGCLDRGGRGACGSRLPPAKDGLCPLRACPHPPAVYPGSPDREVTDKT